MIAVAVGSVIAATSGLLFVFGVNLLYLSWQALRRGAPPPPRIASAEEPVVCVQVPVYDEQYVAERVLDAVCAIDWPSDRLEVQVLDDSDDETTLIVARRAQHWRRRGLRVEHIRRSSREGFKAGALAHGLGLTGAQFIAIFDADFVPPPDFLRRTIGAFDDGCVGFVQARWGHLDEGYSLFTQLQAMAVDFHFLVEQAARSTSGCFTNFTGTAGVWRRAAIEDSGGWSARTLTEDLDLSYRAQLRGWKPAYVEDVVVPEELPVSIDAYRRQQSRWATGSYQSAFRLLGPVLRSNLALGAKFQAAIHLLAYGVGPLMLVQLACYPLLLLTIGSGPRIPWFVTDAAGATIAISLAPWLGFMAAQARRGRSWWSGVPSVLCQAVGAGMSLNTMIAIARATRPGGVFVRTPKHRIERAGQEWRDQAYVRVGDPRALLEAAFGLGALAIVPAAIARDQGLLAVYAGLFGLGFLTVATLSASDLLQVIALRRLGSRAVVWMRAAAPAVALLAVVGVLLLSAAQTGEPFEDGYGHWLIAANLASTGQLHDPLFSMEDTWLPGYQVLAAAVLRVFGLWQLGLLKAMSAVFGVVTAACVYALAPSRRQGLIAVALLILNPVFLFTSGSAVVEPLLTALLMAGSLAAAQGRMKIAAMLAALACLTSTKAWIWVAAVVAVMAFETVRSRSHARALAWAVPAVGILVFLQLGFSPASHSVARGSLEVLSATARGSLPDGAVARLVELATTYGLAALPLGVFAVLGVVRRHSGAAWRFIYLPSAVYLTAIFGLVAAGAYSGSHRYLYPALPAATLLAAAALDRYAVAVKAGTLAASTMLAVGFVPVFSSFAADNAGLAAAGRATTCSPGALLTDSPVAAFYSGKAPYRIAGSQVLPADRAAATSWLAAHGFDAMVLEDISYYRATSVFPDLVRGEASPPFTRLGDQGAYEVAGGKGVQAYAVGAVCLEHALQARITATLPTAPGPGKTSALAKGMTLRTATGSAAGEGMGFGAPIVHYPDGWVYPRTHTDADLSTAASTVWRRTFELDEIGGDLAHDYEFVPIVSRGEIAVTYTFDANGVSIAVVALRLAEGYTEVGLLNEQSSAFDDLAAAGQPTLLGDAIGSWVPVTGSWARLRSGTVGVEWSVPFVRGAALHGGREHSPPQLDWAGLDYVFPAPFSGASYRINVQEAR